MPNHTRTALVVDDDPTQLYVLARLARLAGFETSEANSGERAYASARESLPNVIIADVRIPDFDGFELCRRIKDNKSTSQIPVILVTSMYYQHHDTDRAYEIGRSDARQAGALDLLLRGDALDALIPMLQKVGKEVEGEKSARKPAKKSAKKAVGKAVNQTKKAPTKRNKATIGKRR